MRYGSSRVGTQKFPFLIMLISDYTTCVRDGGKDGFIARKYNFSLRLLQRVERAMRRSQRPHSSPENIRAQRLKFADGTLHRAMTTNFVALEYAIRGESIASRHCTSNRDADAK